MKRAILFVTNLTVAAMWLRVLLVYITHGWGAVTTDAAVCEGTLRPRVMWALGVSAVELVNALVGLTRSNPLQVLMFASVRTAVEVFFAPMLPCTQWEHAWTCACWAIGEVCRFGCFAVDAVVADSPSLSWGVKAVRYAVGPVMFPLGAGGEMLLVIAAAGHTGQQWLYGMAALWPIGFYPLMAQLLKQARKHFVGAPKKRE